jgi:hypothetical protein
MKDTRSLEQVYRSAVNGLYARIKNNYDFLVRKYGDEGLKIIEEMSHEYGLNIARRAKSNLENNDLNSVAQYLIRIFTTVSWGKDMTEIMEISPTKIVIKVYDCPLHFDNVEMCRAHTCMEKTVVEELNPKLNYRIGKSIPAGDKYCEHILENINSSNNQR